MLDRLEMWWGRRRLGRADVRHVELTVPRRVMDPEVARRLAGRFDEMARALRAAAESGDTVQFDVVRAVADYRELHE